MSFEIRSLREGKVTTERSLSQIWPVLCRRKGDYFFSVMIIREYSASLPVLWIPDPGNFPDAIQGLHE